MSAPNPSRQRPLNKRYALAIGYLIDGTATTQRQAAKLASCRADDLSKVLKTEKAQRFIQEQCSKYLKGLPAIRASATLAKLTAARSEDVSARVSQRIVEHAGILIPHALPTGAIASPVPLLSIVFKHADGGSSVAIGVQSGGQVIESAALPALPDAAPDLAKEGGGPGSSNE